MTGYVSSGTLSPTHTLTQSLVHGNCVSLVKVCISLGFELAGCLYVGKNYR